MQLLPITIHSKVCSAGVPSAFQVGRAFTHALGYYLVIHGVPTHGETLLGSAAPVEVLVTLALHTMLGMRIDTDSVRQIEFTVF